LKIDGSLWYVNKKINRWPAKGQFTVIMIHSTDIKELSISQLEAWLSDRGFQPYRAAQIQKWIYLRQMDDFSQMSDIGKPLRTLLSEHFTIERLNPEKVDVSSDGSRKYLFVLPDGNRIETVWMPEKDHSTICISSQVGCAQGCRFCLTGKRGLVRNLTAGEIIAQVRDVQTLVEKPEKLTNIVLMGMGEPLANYDAVVQAIRVLTDAAHGMGFSTRKITLSTAGLAPRIPDLGTDVTVNLAVSLNAADNETRSRLMPINRKYSIETLLDACRRYALRPRRRITFEYILMDGINDSLADAAKLVKLLHGIRSKINLIPFNEHPGCEWKRPKSEAVLRFQEYLTSRNLTAMIRISKGQDILAACGQLRAISEADSIQQFQ
jgi:23S rRNA (adenine2503-C2)-methyltransferase